MANYSVSSSADKPARLHDHRTVESVKKARAKNPKAYANVDVERTSRNRVLVGCPDIRRAFNQAFSSSVAEYNAKQREKGKPGRQIRDYYQKCRDDNKLGEFIREDVLAFGSADEHPPEGEAVAMLEEAFEQWQRENPNLHVLYAVIHLDEATPHLHLCYCGKTKSRSSRGLSERTGFTPAFEGQYGKSAKGDDTAKKKHHDHDLSLLESVLERHGHKRKVMNNDKKHLSVDEFKELAEREQRVAEREQACELREQQIANSEAQLEEMRSSWEKKSQAELEDLAFSWEKKRETLEDGLNAVEAERERLANWTKPQVKDVLECVPDAVMAGRFRESWKDAFRKVWDAMVVAHFPQVVERITERLSPVLTGLEQARKSAEPQLIDGLRFEVNPSDFEVLSQTKEDDSPSF